LVTDHQGMDLFRHKLEAGRRGDRLPWLAAAVASLLSCRAITAVEVAPPIIPAPEPGAEWSDRLRSAAGMPRGHLAADFRRSILLARVSCRKGGGAPPPRHPPRPLRARGFAAAHGHSVLRSVGLPISRGRLRSLARGDRRYRLFRNHPIRRKPTRTSRAGAWSSRSAPNLRAPMRAPHADSPTLGTLTACGT